MFQKATSLNLKKAIRYCKKNGFRKMMYAVLERIHSSQLDEYMPKVLPESELLEQRNYEWKELKKISIIVPAYETKKEYLTDLIASVLAQTYREWELIIADASKENQLEELVSSYEDARIHYIHLKENKGISDNSNEALKAVTGEYTALLDHDDVITEDALYEVAKKIELSEELPVLIYTDEDKGNETFETFYEVNYKREFNLDLFLSNNYICHFAVIKTEYIKELGFRKEYDGAQDYDLFLRIVDRLWSIHKLSRIHHIDRVLYHWRCHGASTAENPESKMYAYEAGRLALTDFVEKQQWKASVEHTEHLGFYKIMYDKNDVFRERQDIGAVGGNIIRRGKIISGAMFLDGTVLYKDLPIHYSGYMHRAAMKQDVDALDIRSIKVNKKMLPAEIISYYQECICDVMQATEEEIRKMSLLLSEMIRETGMRLLFDPDIQAVDDLRRG